MKRNLIIIFSLLLGLSWFAAISSAINNPKEMQAHLDKAEEYEAQGIYVDAIIEYEKALEYEPENLDISMKMANAYLKKGSTKQFTNLCKELAAVYQESELPLNSLVNYYMENHQELAAVKYLDEFTKTYPENPVAKKWMMKLKGSYGLIRCRYDAFGTMVFDNVVVTKEGKFGIINSKGEEILAPLYEDAIPYSPEDLALVKKDGKYIYIDKEGQTRLVADTSYENLGFIYEERVIASSKGKYAYLDEKLEKVTEFIWEELTPMAGGIGAGKVNGKWALLNKKGEAKTEYIYEDVIRDEFGFCSFEGRVFVKENGAYCMLNKKAEVVGELKFDSAKPFFPDGDYAAVCMNGKWGFVNQEGELVIKCQYEDANSFSNGFAAVCKNGKWGYIDETGYMIIEPEFEQAGYVSSEGTMLVLNETWQLIQLNIFK